MSYTRKVMSILLVLALGIITYITPAYADDNPSSLRVDLRIINIESNGSINDKSEFWVKDTINAAADINVSGSGANIPEPWGRVTVPKMNGKIVKPDFAASQKAYETVYAEDENNWYVTYKFKELSGGNRLSLPFPFRFVESTAENGDSVDVKFEILDGNSPDPKNVLYSTNKVYTTKKQEVEYNESIFKIESSYSTGSGGVPYFTAPVLRGETDTGNKEIPISLKTVAVYDTPSENENKLTYIKPTNIKMTVTIPEDITFKTEDNPGWSYDETTRIASIVVERTEGSSSVHTSNKIGIYKIPVVKLKNTPFGDYTFNARYIVDAGLPSERELTPRTTTFNVRPTIFVQTGSMYIFKEGHKVSPSDLHSYSYSNDGKYYIGTKQYNEMMYTSSFSAYNNGATPTEPNGGKVTHVYKIIDTLDDERIHYTGFTFDVNDITGNTNVNSRELVEENVNRFNSSNIKLYGIKANGDRVLIASNVQNNVRVDVNDPNREFVKLELEGEEPFKLDNVRGNIYTYVSINDSEKQKWNNREYSEPQRYPSRVEAEVKISNESNLSNTNKQTIRDLHRNSRAYVDLRKLTPESDINVPDDMRVVYKNTGNKVNYRVGGIFNSGDWGPIHNIEGMKTITLLPPGIEYAGLSRISPPSIKVPEPVIIQNYKNTGKTAIICDIGDIDFSEIGRRDVNIDYTLNVTPYTSRGINKVENYLLYDDNNIITPRSRERTYIDAMDLDGDGDRDEKFVTLSSNIDFIPPLELIVTKEISPNKESFGFVSDIDLGADFFYRIKINNNTVADTTVADIIDVLPHVGDHTIVANDAGEYINRGSAFAVTLSNSVESVPENAEALKLYDVFYQLTPQGADLESVRDGVWVSAADVPNGDFSTVKNIKLVLKPGKVIPTQSEVDIIIPAKMPSDKNLTRNDFAYNTSALSTNHSTFSEANRVTTVPNRYEISGTYFKDFNADGVIGDTEDKVVGHQVELIDATTGNVATDIDGTPIPSVTTDENGKYSFTVYKQGEYIVRFAKENTETFTPVNNKKANNSNVESSTNNHGDSYHISLDSSTPTDIFANAGLLSDKRNIVISKVSSVAGENGIKPGLENVEFKLYSVADDSLVATTTTNEVGRAVFANIPFGEYKIVESRPLPGYEVTEPNGRIINLTPGEFNIQMFENTPIKGTVTVTKTDADSHEAIAGVVFALKQGDNEVATATTNDEGIATFNDVAFGEYTLVEKAAKTGYVASTRTETVNIDRNGKRVEISDWTNTRIKGTVTVTKTDSDTREAISGVEFVLKQGDNEVATATTGQDGVATFSDVVYGEYTLVEKAPKVGYVASTRAETVNIDADGKSVVFADWKNTKIKGNISLSKVDADTNLPLAGVIFALKQGDNEVATATTNDQGVATFSNVVYGDYTVVEKTALVSHVLDTTTIHSVSIRENGTTVVLTQAPLTNTIKKGTVTVTKTDSDTNGPIANVVFALKQGDNEVATATTNDQGVATFSNVVYGEYTLVEKTPKVGYVASTRAETVNIDADGKSVVFDNWANTKIKGTVTVTKTDSDDANVKLEGVVFALKQGDNEIATAVTGADGIATFSNVVYGEYTLVEKTPKVGYVASTRTEAVNIDRNGKRVEVSDWTNTKIKGTVTVTKTDSDSHEAIAGVVFALKQGNVEVATAITGQDGVATFSNVVYGEYTLVEKTPKVGYVASTRAETVNIDADGKSVVFANWTNTKVKGTVTVTKTDADSHEAIAGVVFVLKQGENEVATATTNDLGVARFSNVVFGEYSLVEKTPKVGYVASTRAETVNIDADGKSVVFADWKNTKIKGTVTVTKTDSDDANVKLEGVVFALKQGDNEVATAVTGADGIATFSNVVFGEYTLVEKTPKVGYVASTRTEAINIDTNGKSVAFDNWANTKIKGTVTVTKSDSDSHEVISGVVFALKQGDNEVATATTGQDGVATFSNVVFGEYSLVEKAPKVGYVASTRTETVNIDSNGKSVVFADWKNTKIKGTVTVTKTDSDSNEAIAGVVFALKQGDNEVATATTNDQGVATFSNVVFGEYTLVEKTPKVGYVASTRTETVNIDTNGKSVVFADWKNTKIKGTVTVTKTDSDDANVKLEGVIFALKQGDNEIATATTNDQGVATFSDVVFGEYALVEKVPKVGYVASTRTETVNIDADGKSVVFANWTNTKVKGTVTVTKTDADSHEAIAGVVFALKQGENEVATATTNDQGVATFSNVNYGEYTLVEKTPKVGYVASTRTETVNIDADGKSVVFADWKNTKIKGSVSVLKHDGDSNSPLAGVVFALMQNGQEVATATTGQDGVATFSSVVYGAYTVVEKSTLTSHVLNTETVYNADVRTDGENVYVNENDPLLNYEKKGTVTVTKTDSDTNEAISGVVFALKQGEREVATAATGADGIAIFSGIKYGEYSLVEKVPKVGYVASTRTEIVNIDADGKSVVFADWKNTKIKGTVTVTKTDSDSHEAIAGVVFALKQGDNEVATATTGQDGVATFSNVKYGEYTLVEKTPLKGYVASTRTETVNIDADGKSVAFDNWANTRIKGTVTVTKTDSDSHEAIAGVEFALKQGDKEIATATSGQDGVATFSDVVYGEYSLVEKTPGEGYVASTRVERVNITSDGQAVVFADWKNTKIKGSVSVLKHDGDTNSPLAGVVFALMQNNTEIATATTNDEGIATFANVVYGAYTIIEKSTLTSYILDTYTAYNTEVRANGENVFVNENDPLLNYVKKGTVTVTKSDSDTHEPISGVVFALKQGEREVATATTGQDGVATFSDVVYGEYSLVEKTPKVGYVASSRVERVNITSRGQSVEFNDWSNTKIKGSVTVTKTDSDTGEAIVGVEFALKQNGNEVATATTDSQGVATFSNVKYGEYTLVEKIPAEGYLPSTRTETVNIETDGQAVIFADWKNTKIKGSVSVLKHDGDSNSPLAGVVFALKQGDVEVVTATTGQDGVATFSNVVYGDYTVAEKTTLVSHVLNTETVYNANVRNDGENVFVNETAPFLNYIKKGTVTVTKTDSDTNSPIANVVFALKQRENEVATATTDAQGVATFSNVVYGEYTLVEKTPVEGYVASARSETVNIDSNGKSVAFADWKNTKIKAPIVLTKTDTDSGKPLQGITFELRKGSEVVDTKVTDAEGKVIFASVPYGDYTLVETKTLDSHILDSTPIAVQVRENGVEITKAMSNTVKKGTVIVTKTDSDTHEAISGVVFALKQSDKEISTATTDNKGIATFSNVVYGEYTLVEKTPAQGYTASTRTETVKIDVNGKIVAFRDWTNTKVKPSVSVPTTEGDTAKDIVNPPKNDMKEAKHELKEIPHKRLVNTGIDTNVLYLWLIFGILGLTFIIPRKKLSD
ncbi:hypothetical protein HCQ94_05135 [Actinomyces sp. zg-332]|uniref:SpaA isopeptide-forming pilin-related protein n=1 Tax=Actinomyces sp. zg-332 TaxID=2708340 RepID=UPI00141EA660|nr:SpaA isopeptide-forming pilin-related protein [Actinomyces sp. zg-332]QPK93956.1 hypothetical protein HCQ94_05135 [Actinomyces sp. zg-332]